MILSVVGIMFSAKAFAETESVIAAGVIDADCTPGVLTTMGTNTSGTVMLTAQWEPEDYNVIYDAGSHGSGGATDTATFGQRYDIPAGVNGSVSANTGYTFNGTWKESNGNAFNGEDPWDRTEDLTVYAQYNPKTYNVTYECGSATIDGDVINGELTGNPSQNSTSDTATFDAPYSFLGNNTCELPEHTFNGWNCKTQSNDEPLQPDDTQSWNIDDDVVCTAGWEEKQPCNKSCVEDPNFECPDGAMNCAPDTDAPGASGYIDETTGQCVVEQEVTCPYTCEKECVLPVAYVNCPVGYDCILDQVQPKSQGHIENGQCVVDTANECTYTRVCKTGYEEIDGRCVEECGEGEQRNSDTGECEPIVPEEPQTCTKTCNNSFVCPSNATCTCDTSVTTSGTLDENDNCDAAEPGVCPCQVTCDDGYTMNSNGECEPIVPEVCPVPCEVSAEALANCQSGGYTCTLKPANQQPSTTGHMVDGVCVPDTEVPICEYTKACPNGKQEVNGECKELCNKPCIEDSNFRCPDGAMNCRPNTDVPGASGYLDEETDQCVVEQDVMCPYTCEKECVLPDEYINCPVGYRCTLDQNQTTSKGRVENGVCNIETEEICTFTKECDTGYEMVDGVCKKRCSKTCDWGTCPDNAICTYGNPVTNYGYEDANGVCSATQPAACEPTWTCKEGYELVGGVCKKPCSKTCVRGTCPDNAVCTYGNPVTNYGYEDANGVCDVAQPAVCQPEWTCVSGFHKEGNICEPDVETCMKPCVENTDFECPDNSDCSCDTTKMTTVGHLENGVCVTDNETMCPCTSVCKTGYEEVNGECKEPCSKTCVLGTCPAHATCTYDNPVTNYGYKDANGVCGATQPDVCQPRWTCEEGYELVNGECKKPCEVTCDKDPCPDNAICTYGQLTKNYGYENANGVCDAVKPAACAPAWRCADGYELVNGICRAVCTQDQERDSNGTCVPRACEKPCTVDTSLCPANANCEYDTTQKTQGVMENGSCNAVRTTCPVTFSCKSGYHKNATETACVKDQRNLTYDCGAGTGTASTGGTYDSGTAITIAANTCTKTGSEFIGWNCGGASFVPGDSLTLTTDTVCVATWNDLNCKCTMTNGAVNCSSVLDANNKCNYSWECNDGYYMETQSATDAGSEFVAQCQPCPEGYNAGSDGNRTSKTNCYSGPKTRRWTGSQIQCSLPANCSSKTCVACSQRDCEYVAYSDADGNADGDIKTGCSTNSEPCQQQISSVVAVANGYVNSDGKSCSLCSSYGDGSYTLSDGGNISGGKCYKEVDRKCTQQACQNPDENGCRDVECAESCVCNTQGKYKLFADGTTQGDSSSMTCTKDIVSLIPKDGHYADGITSCPAYGYNVQYTCGTGTGTAPVDSVTYAYNDNVTTKTNTCTKTGYTFKNWKCDGTVINAGGSFAITKDTTCVAQWAKTPYKITYNCAATDIEQLRAVTNNLHYGDTVTLMSYNTVGCESNGYRFDHWDCNTEYSGTTLVMPNKDVECHAVTTPIQYNIEYVLNGGEFPIGSVVPVKYKKTSSNVILPVPVKDGFEFLGWYTNSGFNGNAVTKIPTGSTGDKKFYAKWNFVCNPEHWYHVGEDKICLYETQQTSPTVKLDIDGSMRYMMLTNDKNIPMHKGTNRKMRIRVGNKTYNAHDKSVY